MGMITSAIATALFNGNNLDNVQEAFKEPDITSEAMKRNIDDCYFLFYDGMNNTEDGCMNIPATIINKLVKTTFSEYSARTDNDGINNVLKKLNKIKKAALQAVLLGGEVFIKPIFKDDDIEFTIVNRNCFIPLGRNSDGVVNKVGLTEVTVSGNSYYTLIETRTAGKTLNIKYELYESETKGLLGHRVPLSTLDKYAELEEDIDINIKNSLGMVQVKTPVLNNIDGSNDGVCIYSAAARLIHRINRNEMQMNDEFDLSQKRLIVSSDMFRKDNNGNPHLYDKLFTALDDEPEAVGIHEFSPAIREQNYLNRKNEYLRNIENICGFKRGLLSEVEAQERTAKEITSTEGDYNLSIIDIQDMWKEAVKDVINTVLMMASIYHYNLSFYDVDDIVFDFGDGVLYDRQRTFSELSSMVSAGLLDPVHLIGWYFEIDTTTPEGVEQAKKMMPEMNRLLEE